MNSRRYSPIRRSTPSLDHIVFDTAPTGHTIRLLQLPVAWSGFLEAGKGDASCLGPLAGLEKQRTQYQAAVDALADGQRTRLILVARAQNSALREAARTHEELAAIGLDRQFLAVNGLLPKEEAALDTLAAAIYEREHAALAATPEVLRALPCDRIPLKPFNLVGLDALRHLLVEAPPRLDAADGAPIELRAPSLSELVDGIAADGHGLVMLMGKGGVGKTTIAAAVAVELAHRGLPVHLTTSDPAAHLSETLHGSLPNLTVSRIDPHVETERYRREVLATKGATLDAQGRALLEEDLRSPCTEEIAVFQAFSRVIREAGEKFVVMDTAPTGHTLAAARRHGSLSPRGRAHDGRQGRALYYADDAASGFAANQGSTRDAWRKPRPCWKPPICKPICGAQESSHGRGSSITASRRRARGRRCCDGAPADELGEMEKVTTQHARRYAVVPLLKEEPVGVPRLLELAGHVTEPV